MSKFSFIILAAVVALAASQDSNPQGQGGGQGNQQGCSGDDGNFKGTQPQNLGKSCAEQSPDNCKFIDESIKACCATCQNRQNETPVRALSFFSLREFNNVFLGSEKQQPPSKQRSQEEEVMLPRQRYGEHERVRNHFHEPIGRSTRRSSLDQK